MDYEADVTYWGDAVKEILVIIELKYKANSSAVKAILADVTKLHSYIQDYHLDCHYYLGAIRETEWDKANYIDADNDTWANGRVTELVAACSENDEMQFEVIEHSSNI